MATARRRAHPRRTIPAARAAGIALTWALLASAGAAAAAPDPDTIVARADEIRFPSEDFQVDVGIRTTAPGRDPEIYKYRVLSKGNENTIVLTTYPASERGQVMLMKGSDLWIFLPAVSQPVRLPLSQRLTGQVANGDLARANFAGDYDAELVGTQAIDGEKHYVLELTAAKPGVTYHRVKYWVEADSYRPYKAEFYTQAGRLLKEAYYRAYQELGGAIRPTQMVLVDRLREGERSLMVYADMKRRSLDSKLFTKDYLKKLQ